MGAQYGGDLIGFHPEAADLDLSVGAAEELQPAVGATPHDVAGAVHPPARRERVGDEPGRGFGAAPEVAAGHLFAGEVQLAGDPIRDRS